MTALRWAPVTCPLSLSHADFISQKRATSSQNELGFISQLVDHQPSSYDIVHFVNESEHAVKQFVDFWKCYS